MAKRLHEDAATTAETIDAERAAKKARKEKKSKKTKSEDVSEDAAVDGLSKEERKALKKAKKEKANSEPTTDVDEDAAKAERKALKKAAKKAAKAAESTSVSEQEDAAPAAEVPSSSAKTSSTSYHQSAELTALPQAKIDSFVAENHLAVEDPQKQNYRPMISFKYLDVDESQRAPFKNFTAPTPIQAACWPYLLAGRDVVGVAETGSGKTLAFGVPCVRYIASLGAKERTGIKACIVSPTRELALQIHEQLMKIAGPAGLKATVVYGGTNKDEQRATLKGTHIVIATPGRLNDFVQEGSIDLSKVDYVVLDEADRMLDKGFEQEVRRIISATQPTGRQTLMFTATWPPSVRDLADTFMDKPVKVMIGENASGELRANTRIVQEVEVMDGYAKQDRLIQILKQYQSGKNKSDRILVFCLYKKEATRIEEFIRRKGFPVAGIHGDLSQQKRQESLEAFKRGTVPLLVATDVAARGLDIPAVRLVINVTFPLTAEDYVHRIGRTGRAGQDGKAITFFTDAEKGLAGALINVLKGSEPTCARGADEVRHNCEEEGPRRLRRLLQGHW